MQALLQKEIVTPLHYPCRHGAKLVLLRKGMFALFRTGADTGKFVTWLYNYETVWKMYDMCSLSKIYGWYYNIYGWYYKSKFYMLSSKLLLKQKCYQQVPCQIQIIEIIDALEGVSK